MNVCLHLHDAGQPNWKTHWLGMDRLPNIGDMMVLEPNDGNWWKVELVVHQYYLTQHPVDIYARRVNGQSAVEALVAAEQIQDA